MNIMTTRRKVVVANIVREKIAELKVYLTQELQLSKEAAAKRVDRMEDFVECLTNPADYALCRFKRWRALGYRCAIFENSWIFAYEVFDNGVIVRDMAHAATLVE
jgi:hypothetical protein